MADPVRVFVPKETVSDETVEIRALLYENGARVEADAVIAIIETSKAAVEINAPVGGYIRYLVEPQTEAPVGGPLADISATPELLQTADAAPPPVKSSPLARRMAAQNGVDVTALKGSGARGKVTSTDVRAVTPSAERAAIEANHDPRLFEQRISARARALMDQHNLDPAIFAAQKMVRAADVEAALAGPVPATDIPTPDAVPLVRSETELAHDTTRPDRRKTTERAILAAGTPPHMLPSMVAVRRSTTGLRQVIATDPNLRGNLLALIIYESGRLLRRYPCFNSTFEDGEIRQYAGVNIGFALDDGRGLMVPVIRDVDRKSLIEIVGDVERLFTTYDEGRLSPSDLAHGTFTVSDLSQFQVPFFFPLISCGQGAILGVCGEILPDDGGAGEQSLLLTFDHQVGDGLQAAQFLTDLTTRLSHYETAFRGTNTLQTRMRKNGSETTAIPAVDPFCSVCSRSVPELRSLQARLVKTIEGDGTETPTCTICLSGF